MTDSPRGPLMDPAYYEAQTGSPEHYAAYEKAFTASHGIGFPVADDPAASYEIDNAQELAYERYAEQGDLEADPESDAEWDAEWTANHPDNCPCVTDPQWDRLEPEAG